MPKISELPPLATPLIGSDLLPVVDEGTTKKANFIDVATYLSTVLNPTLNGDVTGPTNSNTVALVGGQTAEDVAAGVILANNATNTISPIKDEIVRRDANGDFQANNIESSLKLIPATGGFALQTNNLTQQLEESAVTNNELSYLSGVTSPIQDQLDNKQPTGDYLTNLTGDVVANGPGSASLIQSQAITTLKIADNAVINTKLAQMPALTFKANNTNATADPQDVLLSTIQGITALTGDVTASGSGSVVATVQNVGGQSSSNVATATGLANAATSLNTAGAIVRRDSLGNFLSTNITSAFRLSGATGNKALQTNSSTQQIEESSVTNTELGYVSGVTSSIQTQLNSKQVTGNYITDLTGDVTASGPGSSASTIANNAVTNAKIANTAVDNTKLSQMAAATIKANNTSSTASPQDVLISSFFGNGTLVLSSGVNTTLTNPMPTYIKITNSGAGFNLTLPDMSQANSLKSNQKGNFWIYNGGNQFVSVLNNSSSLVVSMPPRSFWNFFVESNANADGVFSFYNIAQQTNSTPLTFSTNLTGSVAITGYIIRISKVNNITRLFFPQITLANALSPQPITATTALPAEFRPIQTIHEIKQGVRNTPGPIVFEVSAAGVITIYGNTQLQGFQSAQPLAVDACCLTIYNSP